MPLALLTALRVNAPVVGIADTKLPNMLQRPTVSISCVAFTEAPIATKKKSRYPFRSKQDVS